MMTQLHKKGGGLAARLLAAFALCFGCTAVQAEAKPDSVAFWYADNPPLAELAQFDWAVVEPGHLSPGDVRRLDKLGGKPFAYLSIGEFAGDAKALANNGLSGATSTQRNNAWDSQVMDLAAPAWRNYLFKRAGELQAQGYAGLFLDTLDSFQLLPQGQREAQRQALASLLRELHKREPKLQLFFNRGFEVLSELNGVAAAVAVESIHAGWDAAAKRYRPVPQADRDWLEDQLAPLRAKGLPLVAIEYLPPEQRQQARELAKRLRGEGFIPFVTTPALDYLGVSSIEVQPRRIAVLLDLREGDKTALPGHTLLGGLLEYLGYRIDYFPANEPLPGYQLRGLYAGVVAWMESGPPTDRAVFDAWISKRLDEQVPVAFMAGLPTDNVALLRRLGLHRSEGNVEGNLSIVSSDDSLIGHFEAPLNIRGRDLPKIAVAPGGPVSGLRLRNDQGTFDPLVIGDWGGMVVNPYVVEVQGDARRWVIDPFAFLQKALKLPRQPSPDATTENGRRIATVHIDGDGFPSRAEIPGTPYSARVVLDDFIKTNPYLTSVSIVEGEISPRGIYPFLSSQLEPIAREIFADPKVEIATHTYSHPFFLQPEKAVKHDGFNPEYGLHLKLAGYDKLDFRREIFGSRDYINQHLTTPNKPVKMVFWPGDALPDADTLKLAYEAGLKNVNGGETRLTLAQPSLTNLSPLLRPTSGGLQVYAPIINENMYTNLWHGPYYGFKDVNDTFDLTDSPRRLRGLHLYYHFYSGTKVASIKVMHEIYAHMTREKPISLWMSDWLDRAYGLYETSLARTADGGWQMRGLDGLRTVRLDPAMGWPDLSRSRDVAGVRDLPQGRYVHLAGDQPLLVLRADRDPRPALEEANLPLLQWRYQDDRTVNFAFAGEFPLEFSVRAAGACRVEVKGQLFTAKPENDLWHFKLPMKRVSDAKLFCA